jgi:hypothetical protein
VELVHQIVNGSSAHIQIDVFNILHVEEIVWDDGLLDKLAVEPTLKRLIQGAIKSQMKHLMDDFVKGKGLGLVMNLFGELKLSVS